MSSPHPGHGLFGPRGGATLTFVQRPTLPFPQQEASSADFAVLSGFLLTCMDGVASYSSLHTPAHPGLRAGRSLLDPGGPHPQLTRNSLARDKEGAGVCGQC